MGAAALAGMVTGRTTVRIGMRTARGIEPVAAGVLIDGDRTGNTIRILDETTRELRRVRLTRVHVVAYTPTFESSGSAA